MKKIIIVLAVALLVGIAYAGPNPDAKSIALNTSTFTAITIDASHNGRDIAVTTSDATAWVFSDDAAGTTPLTVPAPGTLSLQCRRDNGSGTVFWAKASAGTPNLSVFVAPCSK